MDPRIVLVRRRTEYESLIIEHATPQMAAFRLKQRGIDIEDVRGKHLIVHEACERVLGRVPTTWRKAWVLREDLGRFRFDPDDIVVGVGYDGLVPNVAKYLNGQPVIGVNPFGITQRMMHFAPDDIDALYKDTNYAVERRSMVEVELDDGNRLIALNELFVGHRSHQSARYDLKSGKAAEFQSSSGIIVTTGTGATGWASSIASIMGLAPTDLPSPCDPWGSFLVREAWASPFTGTSLLNGRVGDRESTSLIVTSKMPEGGLIFGDGIESDHLNFAWGQSARLRIAARTLNLVIPR